MTDRAAPGAHLTADGVAFTLLSRLAEAVELCLFEPGEPVESRRLSLERLDESTWRRVVPGVGPGQLYGYRVHGPFAPAEGHWSNPAKLLVDPYARALTGEPAWNPALHAATEEGGALRPEPTDSAPYAPRSIVAGGEFDWRGDRKPATAWRDTVIYECHVRGATRRHPEVPEELRGSYLGLASEPMVEHLLGLGVTAVELLPVHQIASEPHLASTGRTNYFGYSPLGLFAPHAGYATAPGRQVDEFKRMVRGLHAAGLEVYLDVVFNHTAEGGPTGQTLCWRGIDNPVYYRTAEGAPGRYQDWSGCGNTLDTSHPRVARMVLDALRYWAGEMHVDGFRFDLAPVLGRAEGPFDPAADLLRRIRDDPALDGVKLIAEPWDLGPEGYQLGRFPTGWAEWNDRYRDAVRSFWRGDPGRGWVFAQAVAGSPGTFVPSGRGAGSGVSFVTSHDGFTLADLVSYETKRNRSNGEENRDGSDRNLSRNWGVEGPTDDPVVTARRGAVQRALLASLALARGVPMLLGGDELGRSQLGNNNAYCHDGELTWIDWEPDRRRRELAEFTRSVFGLRRREEALVADGAEPVWYSVAGREMTDADWQRADGRTLVALFPGPRPLLAIFNADAEARLVRPPRLAPGGWRIVLDSTGGEGGALRSGTVRVPAHTTLVLAYGPEGAE